MKLFDLTETYDLSKTRIQHPEDLLLRGGSVGASKAITALFYALKSPKNISIKPDGSPAIKWGRDADGIFRIGDKYMNPLPSSIDEMATLLRARRGGGREDLIEMYDRLWNVFRNSVPTISGFLFGDLMFRTPITPSENRKYDFTPNTVTYSVDSMSSLGQSISKAQAGIVVHTYLKATNIMVGTHISDMHDIPGIDFSQTDLVLIGDHLTSTPKLKPSKYLQIAINMLKEYGNMIDNLLDNSPVGFTDMLVRYVNFRVRKRDFNDMGNDIDLMPSNLPRLSVYYHQNEKSFDLLWKLFLAIAHAKNDIISQLDSVANKSSDVTATINGELGHEGYIIHSSTAEPVKLINRFRFSAANFDK